MHSKWLLPMVVTLAIVCHIALCVGTLMTLRPWIDEAWHGAPAWTLAEKGYLGTPSFFDSRVPHVDRFTYWIMPLYPLLQAVWYKIVPFQLETMRLLSIIFSLAGMLCWAYSFKKVTHDNVGAVLLIGMMAVDYNSVSAGSFGRPDILAFAWQAGSLAVYLYLRTTNLGWAMVLGQTCVVASGMTHPNGGLLSLLANLILVVSLDRSRLRPKHLLLAAIPYGLGAILWGSYILQNPSAFLGQYGFQTGMRFTGLSDPVGALHGEALRYLALMGLHLHSPGSVGPHFLKSSIFLLYGTSIIGSMVIPQLRGQPTVRIWLTTIAAFVLYFTFLEATKATYYLIYLIYFYSAVTVVFLRWCWQESAHRPMARWLIAGTIGAVMLIQVGGLAYRMRRDAYHREYGAAVTELRNRAKPGELIAGSHDLGFALGFQPDFVDDSLLGIETQRKPDWVVIEEVFEGRFGAVRKQNPELSRQLQARLAEYEQVWATPTYRLLRRREMIEGARPPKR